VLGGVVRRVDRHRDLHRFGSNPDQLRAPAISRRFALAVSRMRGTPQPGRASAPEWQVGPTLRRSALNRSAPVSRDRVLAEVGTSRSRERPGSEEAGDGRLSNVAVGLLPPRLIRDR
jgi:hypothetical protein